MKAIIIADKYDDRIILEELIVYLKDSGIDGVVLLDSLDALKENFHNLPDEHYCIFLNPYYRLENFKSFLAFAKSNNFLRISAGEYVLFFKKEPRTTISRDSLFLKNTDPKKDFFFAISNPKISYMTPKVTPPRIIMYTYNRPIYLRLTLNSLMNSLTHCLDVPVTIVVNHHESGETLLLANQYMNKYPQIDVLMLNKNVGFAGLNIGIQWHQPESIVISEDDFILPSSVKDNYPYWPYQMTQRLEHFKSSGWTASLDNLLYNACHEWPDVPAHCNSGYFYDKKEFAMMAQLLCVKTDYWKSKITKEAFIAFDNRLNEETVCAPRQQGYHIGFNEKMDNYFFDKRPAFKIDKDRQIVDVTNLRTQEKRIIDLNDILK